MATHSRSELELIGLVPELLQEDIKLFERRGPLRQCSSMQELVRDTADQKVHDAMDVED